MPWIDFCFIHDSRISRRRFLPTPSTSSSFFDSFSMMSKTFGPNFSTIRFAYFGPMPSIKPLPR